MTRRKTKPGDGHCGFCNRHVSLTKSGHMRLHGHSDVRQTPPCPGSAHLPTQVSPETLQIYLTDIDARLKLGGNTTALSFLRSAVDEKIKNWKETPFPS